LEVTDLESPTAGCGRGVVWCLRAEAGGGGWGLKNQGIERDTCDAHPYGVRVRAAESVCRRERAPDAGGAVESGGLAVRAGGAG